MTPIEREPPPTEPFDLGIARCTVAAGLTFACASVSDHLAPATQHALERLLDPHERTHYRRIHDQADRRCYVAAHGLLRIELSLQLGLAPPDWQYLAKAGHPPAIRTPSGLADHLRFSLSHTHGLVACAVANAETGPYRDLGIDVEWIRPVARMAQLARRYFTRAEADELLALPRARQHARYFSLWTLRQAWAKARAHIAPARRDPPASGDLSFSFDENENLAAPTFTPELADEAQDWRFWLHHINSGDADAGPTGLGLGGHVIALAAHRNQSIV